MSSVARSVLVLDPAGIHDSVLLGDLADGADCDALSLVTFWTPQLQNHYNSLLSHLNP